LNPDAAAGIIRVVNTEQKLDILADASKFDLACACKFKDEPGRSRGADGRWVYPAVLPSGRKVMLLKTLQSNACVNDCVYCPFNRRRDLARCSLGPDQMARTFMDLLQSNRVSGLFLSSGVPDSPDQTMDRMLGTAEILRHRFAFKGYIHLKVIPGASAACIEQAVRLATRVSVNIEAPSEERLARLSTAKRFYQDIVSTMQTITDLRAQINRRCHQTTQFVVGAADETDREIVTATARLYERFRMERVYFSAYQDPVAPRPTQSTLFGDAPMPRTRGPGSEGFVREHRLYQVDFLLRKYGFARQDILFDENGNLALDEDPKTRWAMLHPEFYPVPINTADSSQLLRIPGIGPTGVQRIIQARRQGRIHGPEELRRLCTRSRIATPYVRFA
jgi:predicted DNA-binding helix-hairpin-helix protein